MILSLILYSYFSKFSIDEQELKNDPSFLGNIIKCSEAQGFLSSTVHGCFHW